MEYREHTFFCVCKFIFLSILISQFSFPAHSISQSSSPDIFETIDSSRLLNDSKSTFLHLSGQSLETLLEKRDALIQSRKLKKTVPSTILDSLEISIDITNDEAVAHFSALISKVTPEPENIPLLSGEMSISGFRGPPDTYMVVSKNSSPFNPGQMAVRLCGPGNFPIMFRVDFAVQTTPESSILKMRLPKASTSKLRIIFGNNCIIPLVDGGVGELSQNGDKIIFTGQCTTDGDLQISYRKLPGYQSKPTFSTDMWSRLKKLQSAPSLSPDNSNLNTAVSTVESSPVESSPAALKPIITTWINTLHSLSTSSMTTYTLLRTNIAMVPVDSISLDIGANMEILQVESPGMDNFSIISQGKNITSIRLNYRTAFTGTRTAIIKSRMAADEQKKTITLDVPVTSLIGAMKETGTVAFCSEENLLIENVETIGAERIDPMELDPLIVAGAPAPVFHAYKYSAKVEKITIHARANTPMTENLLYAVAKDCKVKTVINKRHGAISDITFMTSNISCQEFTIPTVKGTQILEVNVMDKSVPHSLRDCDSGQELVIPIPRSIRQNNDFSYFPINIKIRHDKVVSDSQGKKSEFHEPIVSDRIDLKVPLPNLFFTNLNWKIISPTGESIVMASHLGWKENNGSLFLTTLPDIAQSWLTSFLGSMITSPVITLLLIVSAISLLFKKMIARIPGKAILWTIALIAFGTETARIASNALLKALSKSRELHQIAVNAMKLWNTVSIQRELLQDDSLQLKGLMVSGWLPALSALSLITAGILMGMMLMRTLAGSGNSLTAMIPFTGVAGAILLRNGHGSIETLVFTGLIIGISLFLLLKLKPFATLKKLMRILTNQNSSGNGPSESILIMLILLSTLFASPSSGLNLGITPPGNIESTKKDIDSSCDNPIFSIDYEDYIKIAAPEDHIGTSMENRHWKPEIQASAIRILARVDEHQVKLIYDITLVKSGTGPALFRLPVAGSAPTLSPEGLKLTGSASEGWTIMVEKEGLQAIRLILNVPVSRDPASGKRFFSADLPLCPEKTMDLKIQGSLTTPQIEHCLRMTPVDMGTRNDPFTRFLCLLGTSEKLSVSWFQPVSQRDTSSGKISEPSANKSTAIIESAVAEKRKPRVCSVADTTAVIGNGHMEIQTSIKLAVSLSPMETITLNLPDSLKIKSIDSPDLESSTPLINNGNRLLLKFRNPFLGNKSINISAENIFASETDSLNDSEEKVTLLNIPVPEPVDCALNSGTIKMVCEQGMELIPSETINLIRDELQTDDNTRDDNPFHTAVMAYRYSMIPVRLTLKVIKRKSAAMPPLMVDMLNIRMRVAGQRILVKSSYTLKNSGAQFLRLPLPENARVISASMADRPSVPVRDNDRFILLPLKKSDLIKNVFSPITADITYIVPMGRNSFSMSPLPVPDTVTSYSELLISWSPEQWPFKYNSTLQPLSRKLYQTQKQNSSGEENQKPITGCPETGAAGKDDSLLATRLFDKGMMKSLAPVAVNLPEFPGAISHFIAGGFSSQSLSETGISATTISGGAVDLSKILFLYYGALMMIFALRNLIRRKFLWSILTACLFLFLSQSGHITMIALGESFRHGTLLGLFLGLLFLAGKISISINRSISKMKFPDMNEKQIQSEPENNNPDSEISEPKDQSHKPVMPLLIMLLLYSLIGGNPVFSHIANGPVDPQDIPESFLERPVFLTSPEKQLSGMVSAPREAVLSLSEKWRKLRKFTSSLNPDFFQRSGITILSVNLKGAVKGDLFIGEAEFTLSKYDPWPATTTLIKGGTPFMIEPFTANMEITPDNSSWNNAEKQGLNICLSEPETRKLTVSFARKIQTTALGHELSFHLASGFENRFTINFPSENINSEGETIINSREGNTLRGMNITGQYSFIWGKVQNSSADSSRESSRESSNDISAAPVESLLICKSSTLVSVADSSLNSYSSMDIRISRAPAKSLDIVFTDPVQIVAVEGSQIESWEPIAGKPACRISFRTPQQGYVDIIIRTEDFIGNSDFRKKISLPSLVGAKGASGFLIVEASADTSLETGTITGMSPTPQNSIPSFISSTTDKPFLWAFKYNSLPATLELKGHAAALMTGLTEIVGQNCKVHIVAADDDNFIGKCTYTLVNKSSQFLSIRPGDATLIGTKVMGRPVKPVKQGKNSATLMIPLPRSKVSGNSLDPFEVMISFTTRARRSTMDKTDPKKRETGFNEKRSKNGKVGIMDLFLPVPEIDIDEITGTIVMPQQEYYFNISGDAEMDDNSKIAIFEIARLTGQALSGTSELLFPFIPQPLSTALGLTILLLFFKFIAWIFSRIQKLKSTSPGLINALSTIVKIGFFLMICGIVILSLLSATGGRVKTIYGSLNKESVMADNGSVAKGTPGSAQQMIYRKSARRSDSMELDANQLELQEENIASQNYADESIQDDFKFNWDIQKAKRKSAPAISGILPVDISLVNSSHSIKFTGKGVAGEVNPHLRIHFISENMNTAITVLATLIALTGTILIISGSRKSDIFRVIGGFAFMTTALFMATTFRDYNIMDPASIGFFLGLIICGISFFSGKLRGKWATDNASAAAIILLPILMASAFFPNCALADQGIITTLAPFKSGQKAVRSAIPLAIHEKLKAFETLVSDMPSYLPVRGGSIFSRELKGKLFSEHAELTARFRFSAQSNQWNMILSDNDHNDMFTPVTLFLISGELAISKVSCTGIKAKLIPLENPHYSKMPVAAPAWNQKKANAYGIQILEPGLGTIEISFTAGIAKKSDGYSISMTLPDIMGVPFSIQMEENSSFPILQGGLLTESSPTSLQGILQGGLSEISFRKSSGKMDSENNLSAEPQRNVKPRLSVKSDNQFMVQDLMINGRCKISVTASLAPVTELYLPIPEEWDILEIRGGNISGWSFLDNEKTVRINFSESLNGKTVFMIDSCRFFKHAVKDMELPCPIPVSEINGKPDMFQATGSIINGTSGNIAIDPVKSLHVSTVMPEEIPSLESGNTSSAAAVAFQSSNPDMVACLRLTEQGELTSSEIYITSQEISTLIKSNGIEMSSITLSLINRASATMAITLPSEARVLNASLDREDITPWQTAEGTILLPLTKAGRNKSGNNTISVTLNYTIEHPPVDGVWIETIIFPQLKYQVEEARWNLSCDDGISLVASEGDYTQKSVKTLNRENNRSNFSTYSSRSFKPQTTKEEKFLDKSMRMQISNSIGSFQKIYVQKSRGKRAALYTHPKPREREWKFTTSSVFADSIHSQKITLVSERITTEINTLSFIAGFLAAYLLVSGLSGFSVFRILFAIILFSLSFGSGIVTVLAREECTGGAGLAIILIFATWMAGKSEDSNDAKTETDNNTTTNH